LDQAERSAPEAHVAILDLMLTRNQRKGEREKRSKRSQKFHEGLLGIKLVRKANPNIIVIVWSRLASFYKHWALTLGADEVLEKRDDVSLSALEIDSAILRHSRSREEETNRRGLLFVGGWIVTPLLIAVAVTLATWNLTGSSPFLRPADRAFLPLAIAFLFILTGGVTAGQRDPWIRTWRPFFLLRKISLWLLGVLSAGILYDLVKTLPSLHAWIAWLQK
jgi:hypothetical protein